MTLHFQVKISSTHIIWILFSTRKRGTNKELELNNTQEVDEKSSSSDCNNDFSVSESSSVPADSDVKSNIRSLNRDQRNVFEDVHRWSRQNMSNAGHPKFNMKWNQWGWLWKVKFTQDNLPSSH